MIVSSTADPPTRASDLLLDEQRSQADSQREQDETVAGRRSRRLREAPRPSCHQSLIDRIDAQSPPLIRTAPRRLGVPMAEVVEEGTSCVLTQHLADIARYLLEVDE